MLVKGHILTLIVQEQSDCKYYLPTLDEQARLCVASEIKLLMRSTAFPQRQRKSFIANVIRKIFVL
jgi:hypothetical protein